jgi:hypothetical protein
VKIASLGFALSTLLAGACASIDDVGTASAEAKGAGASGVDPCAEVAADRSGSLGLSSTQAILGSGALDYASPNRICPRFVVDIGVPAGHQPASAIQAVALDEWSSLTATSCPGWQVVATVYERTDKQNLKTGKWSVGQETKAADFTLKGVWSTATQSCTLALADGSVPSFLPPTGAGEQLVVRVAAAGNIAGTPGSLSLAAGLGQ